MEDITLDIKISSPSSFKDQFIKLLCSYIVKVNRSNLFQVKQNKLADLKEKIGAAISGEHFSQAILLLMELMDFQHEIKWHLFPATELTGHELLIRDARTCETANKSNEPYIIMALNYLRATKVLLSEKQYESIQTYLGLLIRNFYVKVINLPCDEKNIIHLFKHFNTVLINNIAHSLGIKFNEAKERLNLAKDFANLDDSAKDIVTLTTLQDQHKNNFIVFQGEIALTKLTKEIAAEYKERKEKKWYQLLPLWQQALVDHYAPLILKENRVIPTQLRFIPLPGLRNCYRSIYGVVLNILKNKVEITTHVFHSGTLVALGKDFEENKRINLLNADQLKLFTNSQKILALTLNSDKNLKGNDKAIVSSTNYIAKEKGFYHANLPLNLIRRFSPNDNSGIITILSITSQFVLDNLSTAIKKFKIDPVELLAGLTKLSSHVGENLLIEEKNFLAQIMEFIEKNKQSFPDYEIASQYFAGMIDIIDVANEIFHLINHNKNPIDPNNRNLVIGCYTNVLVTLLQPYFEIAIISCCESGKDRDGLLMFRSALISYSPILFGEYSLDSTDAVKQAIIKNNIIRLARARHTQFLAGCQCACGTFGIKNDSRGAIPEKEFPKEASDILIQETASFNKDIAVLENIQVIFFPFGNTNIEIQRKGIMHVLTLQEKIENAFVKNSLNFFQSSTIKTGRTQLLSNTLSSIKETKSLEEMAKIIHKAAKAQLKLTNNTVHGAGTTHELLTEIYNSLDEVIHPSQAVKIFST